MGLPTSLGAYADIQPVLETAVRENGLTIQFETRAGATRWRQRANYYRKLLRAEAERRTPNTTPESPYDHLILGVKDEPPSVVISVTDAGKITGFFSPSGEEVKIETPDSPDQLARIRAMMENNDDD